ILAGQLASRRIIREAAHVRSILRLEQIIRLHDGLHQRWTAGPSSLLHDWLENASSSIEAGRKSPEGFSARRANRTIFAGSSKNKEATLAEVHARVTAMIEVR